MSEQCTATNNTYYLRRRENIRTEIFRSPDNTYGLQQIGDSILLGPLEGTLTPLPIAATDIGILSPYTFHWSPDSRYVALGGGYGRGGGQPLWLALTDGRQLTLLTPEDHGASFVAWSPDSQYLAWISREPEYNGYDNERVVIQSPDTHVPLISIADSPPIHIFKGIGWSFNGAYFAWIAVRTDQSEELNIWSVQENRQSFKSAMIDWSRVVGWSPGANWLAGQIGNKYVLLSADGTEFLRFPTNLLTTAIHSIWSPDGNALAFLGYDDVYNEKLTVINSNGQMFEDTIADKDTWLNLATVTPWIHWLPNGHTLFYVKYLPVNDTYLPMLYDSESGLARPLLSSGESLLPPIFSANYSKAFLVHQDGSEVWIKSIDIDSGSEKILVDDALSAEQLTLFNDDRHLVYAIWRNQGWQIELADVETGQRQLLQDNLKQVRNVIFNEKSDTITVWWMRQDNTMGVSSYSSDGRLFYQSEIEYTYRATAAEFWSPNGETAVIKLDGGSEEVVVVAYPDNRESVVVRNGLSGLGDPYWSPDSQLFAFTQIVTPLVSKGIDLEIVDTAGNTLWSYSPFPLDYGPTYGKNTLEWVVCP